MINSARPNTGVTNNFLSERILLCCGEDYGKLLLALNDVGFSTGAPEHIYRCYRFRRFDEFTLIWTGIGTGCLEPLLYEILSTDQLIERVLLIGTAGALVDSVTKGSAAYISRAINAATPFAQRGGTPNLPTHRDEKGLTILSTDLYYGFSPLRPDRLKKFHQSFPWMRERFDELRAEAQLIDMETAQFYSLCQFYGSPDLEFAAFKGAANNATSPDEQTLNSLAVLRSALSHALPLMA